MNELDAAEEILRGPYSTCIYCRGAGKTSAMPPLKVHDILEVISCKKCRGSGKWLRGDYRMACAVLGMECPKVPKSVFGYTASNTFNSLTHRSPDSWASLRILPGTIVRISGEYAESDFLKEP